MSKKVVKWMNRMFLLPLFPFFALGWWSESDDNLKKAYTDAWRNFWS